MGMLLYEKMMGYLGTCKRGTRVEETWGNVCRRENVGDLTVSERY